MKTQTIMSSRWSKILLFYIYFSHIQVWNFINEKRRQVKALNILYENTLYQDGPQVAAYKNADIPRAVMTEEHVFICLLNILPNKQDEFEMFNSSNIGDETKWYNNDEAAGKVRYWKDFLD